MNKDKDNNGKYKPQTVSRNIPFHEGWNSFTTRSAWLVSESFGFRFI